MTSRTLVLAALTFAACGGTSPGPAAPAARPAERAAVVAEASAVIEWGAPEPIAEELVSEDFLVPLAAAVAPSGALAVAWSDGGRGRYDVWVAESSNRPGTPWSKCRVGRSNGTSAPRPSLAFDRNGELVVAWTAPWDEAGAATFTVRGADGRWSIPAAVERHACGDVALSTGPDGVTAAFVRGVKKFSAKKLLGDVVHDPPIESYSKVAVATLDGGSWQERMVVDPSTLLEAGQPRLSGDQLLLMRSGLLGRAQPSRDLVHVDLRSPETLETLASGEEFDGAFDSTALAVDRDRVLVAFTTRDGIRLRERSSGSWSDPLLVLPAPLTSQPSLAPTSRGLVLAAVSRSTDSILYAVCRAGRWSTSSQAFPAQSALLFTAADAPLLLWCDGLPPITPDRWNGHAPERFRRRIFIARAISPN